MQLIDLRLEERADPDGLRQFLGACREAAEADGHAKIASIALAVRHIDPLAVLDSIYEGAAHHGYLENRRREWAVAGAEAVLAQAWNGPGRFRGARAFADEIERHTIAIGDPALPFFGPLVFAAFSFFDSADAQGEAFPAGMAFVPQWQVARRGDRYVAVANALVRPGGDIEPLAARIWKAHQTFTAFSYDQAPQAPAYNIVAEREVGPPGAFQHNVARALERIAAGAYQKIVLARALDLEFDHACQPLRILNRLREDYAGCTAFSFQRETGASFIGATPERLIAVDHGRFQTEALAGSAPRAPCAGADARLAHALLTSEKDLREHRHVVESIRRRLAALGLEVRNTPAPGLLVLPNVQHLRTPMEGVLPSGVHILDIAAALHPTPAVGGTPREAALPDIAAWEPFARGLFGGMVGWFNTRGEGEFVVGIRSALMRGPKARLFAGAGIVAGSVAEAEYRETSLKMEALLAAIRGTAGR